jgi:hypothetical protein
MTVSTAGRGGAPHGRATARPAVAAIQHQNLHLQVLWCCAPVGPSEHSRKAHASRAWLLLLWHRGGSGGGGGGESGGAAARSGTCLRAMRGRCLRLRRAGLLSVLWNAWRRDGGCAPVWEGGELAYTSNTSVLTKGQDSSTNRRNTAYVQENLGDPSRACVGR